jgi:GNAT superfamily N-acetyltransferase
MAVQFKVGAPADIETFLLLMREYYDYDGHTFEEGELRRALADLLANTAFGYAWLILEDETIIGYMAICFGFSLEFGGRDAFVDEIYMREAHRGRDIGSLAIQHMLETCRVNGIRALHLEVMPGNSRVIQLYERNGFENRGSNLMSQRLAANPGDA